MKSRWNKSAGVALLAEGVDRNRKNGDVAHDTLVALLAEGVDRNEFRVAVSFFVDVALLAEGVDRNDVAGF